MRRVNVSFQIFWQLLQGKSLQHVLSDTVVLSLKFWEATSAMLQPLYSPKSQGGKGAALTNSQLIVAIDPSSIDLTQTQSARFASIWQNMLQGLSTRKSKQARERAQILTHHHHWRQHNSAIVLQHPPVFYVFPAIFAPLVTATAVGVNTKCLFTPTAVVQNGSRWGVPSKSIIGTSHTFSKRCLFLRFQLVTFAKH